MNGNTAPCFTGRRGFFPSSSKGDGGNCQGGELGSEVAVIAPRKPEVFVSLAMRTVLNTVERVGESDAPVLLVGETGVGKEVVARRLHEASRRNCGPLLAVNCSALPGELIESELFGSRKGSFTGSFEDRPGLFQQANGGSLFLDEITEMPLGVQAKLLRVLQEKRVRPVGSAGESPIDCRIITSTNREIGDALRGGKLRQDLFYRINTVTIKIPPLRERTDDILPLAEQFLVHFTRQESRVVAGFTAEARQAMLYYGWPGNVRELENAVHRGVLMTDGNLVNAVHLELPAPVRPDNSEKGAGGLTVMEAAERKTIMEALERLNWNKRYAAEELGIGRQTLYNKMEKYHIRDQEPKDLVCVRRRASVRSACPKN